MTALKGESMTDTEFTSIGIPSWTVERWVRRNSQLTGTPFLVALTVASMHSSKYGYAFPSLDKIAESARISIKTAQRGVEEMKQSGEWNIISGRGGRIGSNGEKKYNRANRYHPTRLLAEGPPLSEEEQANKDLATSLDAAGIANQEERTSLSRIMHALPHMYVRDFIRAVGKPEHKAQVEEIIAIVSELGENIDLTKLLYTRVFESSEPPRRIIPWLTMWGLTAVDPLEFSTDEDSNDDFFSDYL